MNPLKIYLNKKLFPGTYIGLDLASKTGWAILRVGDSVDLIDYGSISLPSKMVTLDKLGYTTNILKDILSKYIKGVVNVYITIENCYLGKWYSRGKHKWNPLTFKFLAWLEGYTMCMIKYTYTNPSPKIIILYPSQSRKLVGVKGTASKKEIVNIVNTKLLKKNLFKQIHNNICDAIILALAGGVYETESK